MRNALVPLMIVSLLVLAAPLAVAAGEATVEAPMELEGANAETSSGQFYLHGGTSSIVFSDPTGAIEIWTYRVPCFQANPDACLEGSGETQRRSVDITGGSVTVLPNEDASVYEAYTTLDDGGYAELSGQALVLGLLEENVTDHLHESSRAPDRFNTVSLTKGTMAGATDGIDLTAQGRLTMSVANATLVVVDADGQQQRLTTGWSWEPSDREGFQDRVLRLVNIVNTGELSVDWDGSAVVTPSLPLGLRADVARLNLTSGTLAGHEATGEQVTIEDLEATVTAAELTGGSSDDSQATGTFDLQQGIAAPDTQDPDPEDEVSATVVAGASAAVVALMGAVAYYWPRLSWGATVLGLPMYSRIERSELLDNDTREQLYEAVKDEPGIHAHALSEAVEIGWGTTVYHLRRLEKNGMVTSEKRGRYRRFFPAAGYVARTREILSVLQNETTNDIARTILKEPGLNQKAICEKLDISPSLANWHIKRLVEADLVEKERRGRTVHYTPGKAWDEVGDEVEMAVS